MWGTMSIMGPLILLSVLILLYGATPGVIESLSIWDKICLIGKLSIVTITGVYFTIAGLWSLYKQYRIVKSGNWDYYYPWPISFLAKKMRKYFTAELEKGMQKKRPQSKN